jgi:tetratricopeptide (TPR) repeat protein
MRSNVIATNFLSLTFFISHLQDCLSQIFVASRDGSSTGKSELDSIAKQLALNNLLEVLGSANDMKVATIVSESLKEVWKAHLDNELRWKLDTAVAYLLSGKVSQALQNFSEVVDEDPYYAEAWNKASTCEFMMGNMDASLAAAQKTIECLPTHFQALNGLGLVYYEKKDVTSAIDCFRKSMDIDPWSPVSARLSVCLDTLKTAKEFEAGEDQNDP